MKRKRYSEEQIISILKEHEAGASVPDLSRQHGVAQNTIYRWKSRFGGMQISEAKRLRELEGENAKLKRLLAEAERDQGCAAGARAGKMVTAAQRRRAVEHLTRSRIASRRRACRLVALSRSVAQYRRKGRNDAVLRTRLRALAEAYPRYGYPTLHEMLKTEGLVINRKRTYRLYREQRLQVRPRRRKKLTRPRVPMRVPSTVNERWSLDFMSDQLANGRRLRVLHVVDDYTRECILQIVDFSISGQRLANELDQLARRRRLPKTLVCDNGPELTCKAMFFWSRRTQVRLHFIQPGKPTQNPFIESFNGKFRQYCLDLNWFASLNDAREIIERWRTHYNDVRPHRSLGKPPAVFARAIA